MIVMVFVGLFVPGAAVAEIVPGDDARFFEQPHRPVDRGNADFRIDRRRTPEDLLDIRMIARVGQDARNDPALAGHFQALIDTELFDP
jgi:hypothetical protein